MSPPENIRVSIIDPDCPVSTVRVDGVVDTVTSKEVERAIEGLIRRNQFRIVMDLAGVDYISSAGWGVFISHLKESREHSGDLRLSGMIPNVREIFELLEFDTILNSFESASQAAQSFERELAELEGGPRMPTQTTNGGLDELAAIGVDTPSSGLDEQTISSGSRHESAQPPAAGVQAVTPEETLKSLVAEDPFASISELSAILRRNHANHGQSSFSWWSVFRSLWRLGLLSRRSRFKLARRQTHSQGAGR